MRESSTAGSFSLDSNHFQRNTTIHEFLPADPDGLSPSQNNLDHLKGHMIRQIQSAVCDLLKLTKTDDLIDPQIYVSLRSLSFFNVCKRVYNVNTRDELRKKFALIQPQSPLSLIGLFRALTAAAVAEWVFERRNERLPLEGLQNSNSQASYGEIFAKCKYTQ